MSHESELNKKTYNRIAADWHKDHTNDSWWVEGTDAFVRMLPSDAEVLDVGCGAGTKTKYLTKQGLQVSGVDLSENMIELARRDSPNNAFYVADMHDLSTVPGTYDGIFVQAALLHIPKKEVDAVLDELIGKLKPGGCLYLAVKGKRDGEPEESIITEADYGYSYDRFFSYFTLDELKGHLAKHGLACVYEHVESMGKRDWLQVVGRKG